MQPYTCFGPRIKMKGITDINYKCLNIGPQPVEQVIEVMDIVTAQYKLNINKPNDFKRAKHLIQQMIFKN